MKDELQRLFQHNRLLIDIINQIIYNFHTQNQDKALRLSTNFISMLDSGMALLYEAAGQERAEILNNMLQELFRAQSTKDYVLQADLYELQLRRFFLELQEDIIASEGFTFDEAVYQNNREPVNKINPQLCNLIYSGSSPYELTNQGYEAEFTSCGHMTLALTDKLGRYYMHSNGRVSEEAFTLASSWYKEEIQSYIVYGYGLGYHIKELAELDSGIDIEVYEADINILKLAAAYTQFGSIIAKQQVKLVYDPDYTKLLQRLTQLTEEEKFVIHYPSLRNVHNSNIKEKLENYFIQYSSIENQRKLMNRNFKQNIRHYDGLAEEVQEKFWNKNLYIIAAGPSLDKNYQQLKEVNRDNSIILASGTVFRKLLTAGITPDYVIVTDANDRVYAQIAGLEASQVPMLYLSTAFQGFARNYQGKKYMICQRDYDKAENFAREHNSMLIHTGGSVSTTALDLGIALGCRRIIFFGLDLAFTGNFVHASGTSLRELKQTKDLRQVKDINGNLIYTSKTLDMYRQWIEKRIREVNNVEFIDATEGGAVINGMKLMSMEECIKRL